MLEVEIRSSNFGSGIFGIYKYSRMSTHSKADNEGDHWDMFVELGYVCGSRNSKSGFSGIFKHCRMSTHSKADNEGGLMGYIRSRNSKVELRIRHFRDFRVF